MKISELKGIGEKSEKLFNKLGIYTVEELILHYPRDYETYGSPALIREIEPEKVAVVEGVITKAPGIKKTSNLQVVVAYIKDRTGDMLELVWFNMPYLKNTLKIGTSYIFRGRIKNKMNKYGFVMEQPVIFMPEAYLDKMDKIQPVYTLTKGLSNNLVLKAVNQGLSAVKDSRDFIPDIISEQYGLPPYALAVKNMHFPPSYEDLIAARNRLAFEEFFLFIYTLKSFKQSKFILENDFHISGTRFSQELLTRLPYSLTNAQLRTLNEVQSDLYGKKAMSRLIQGDVGSGKTIIAILALIDTVVCGYQGALMAPTEVLAVQHFQTISELFQKYHIPIKSVLLTGSVTSKAKKEVYQLIESGEAGLIVGTQALIQENLTYHNLALVITDEQHRFGVRQRQLLSMKGKVPNILVMSATPIPRTLALILYGDLDISVIDEIPKNRLPIKNCIISQELRNNAYNFIEKELLKGRQAYIICPAVEEGEAADVENVMDYTKKVKAYFNKDLVIQYLHGRMGSKEKNKIFQRFLQNEIQILVSTTVIEVGINVPNATVIIIENAERFGLAALHQLRGRVGRGVEQSYCIFVSTTSKKETLNKLEILNKSNDGFEIANQDLKTRGPGDLFGIRQSGEFAFKVGDIYQDADLIKYASEAADLIYQNKTLLLDKERELIEEKCQLTKELLML